MSEYISGLFACEACVAVVIEEDFIVLRRLVFRVRADEIRKK